MRECPNCISEGGGLLDLLEGLADCDCSPDGEEWETMQPNLSSLVFEMSIEFVPASQLGDSLMTEARRQRIPGEHQVLIERCLEILGDNGHLYTRVEVWEIDVELDDIEGYVFLMYPREGGDPVMVDVTPLDDLVFTV